MNRPMHGVVEVYRLEHSDGAGVYSRAAVLDQAVADHRPYTEDDGLPPIWALEHMHFAFADLSALRAWFDPAALEYMQNHDVQCSVYRVPACKVLFGNKQCAFVRSESELTDIIDLEYFVTTQENVA